MGTGGRDVKDPNELSGGHHGNRNAASNRRRRLWKDKRRIRNFFRTGECLMCLVEPVGDLISHWQTRAFKVARILAARRRNKEFLASGSRQQNRYVTRIAVLEGGIGGFSQSRLGILRKLDGSA